MSYSFEYIDIILLAMIAGFIFLRLRGILGKRTGFEGKTSTQLKEVLKTLVEEWISASYTSATQQYYGSIKNSRILY